VVFEDNQRHIGEAAKCVVSVNPTNAVYDAKRLIGRLFDDPLVQADMKIWPFQVINDAGMIYTKIPNSWMFHNLIYSFLFNQASPKSRYSTKEEERAFYLKKYLRWFFSI